MAHRGNEARKILADLADAAGRVFDVMLSIADLPANGELVVLVRGAEP